MNYPLISEYIEAVKNAEDNFDALSHLRPVLDANGEPIMTSGNFAVVFKMKDPQTGKYYAIKCFLKEQEGRAEAYRLISEELEYVSSTFLTPIKYLDKELFVDSQSSSDTEFPVLQMDWVEGETLDKYVRNHIDDQYELAKLAYQFSRLAMWLMPQPFAHGDLKPDNILVRQDGMLVLVDYDGMFVPAMQGQKARELGSPYFRHPLRTEDDFNEHIDDFAIVSLLLSLKALSLHPDFLSKYGASDRLLLSEKDYRDISQCALLKELYPSPDAELNILISLFTLALEKKSLSSVSFRLLDLARPKEVANSAALEPVNTKVTEEDLADAWTDKYGVKYSKDKTRLLKGYYALTSYTILPGTKVICDLAFFECRSLKEISIPNSVTNIGDETFYDCRSLKEISIPNSVTDIGDWAFHGCSSLKEISIPNSVTNIGNNPFLECEALEKINCVSKHFIFRNDALYTADMTKIIAYIGQAQTFTIPNSVTNIGNHAFDNCSSSLKEISIPNSVTNIGDEAFSWCYFLEEISIPNSVTNIGDDAFFECSSLKEISIPNSVTNIGNRAFYGCSSLKEISIPNSVTNIGDNPFRNCKALEKINCVSKHFVFRDDALYTADMTKIIAYIGKAQTFTIPNSVTNIGDYAFDNCSSLKEIYIPNSVTNIGDDAFYNCSSLKEISIPNSVTNIGDSAFYWCSSLKEISIPNSVTNIGDNPFRYCIALEKINCVSKHFVFRDDVLYTADMTKIIAYIGQAQTFTIPNSVTNIGDWAFHGCSSLKEISIPNSVTNIGNGAFSRCDSLETIHIPYGTRSKFEKMLSNCKDKLMDEANSIVLEPVNTKVTYEDLADAWTDKYGVNYSKDKTRLLKGYYALTSYTILPGTKVICDSAFSYCSSLKEISIPNSVTNIGDGAFWDCRSLKEISIPNSVTNIGNNPFSYCYALEKINCVSKHFIFRNDALYTADMTKIIAYIGKAQTFTIPNSVTNIGNWTFSGHSSLKEISIPNSVTNIGDDAFYECRSLKEISIPNSVTNIGDNPFRNCKALEKINCVSKHFVFRDDALYTADMTKIIAYIGQAQTFTIPNSVTNIGNWAFYKCSILKEISIPNSVTNIGNHAFYKCSILQEISIPNSVTNIGNHAFEECWSLQEISIPNSVTSIGNGAFSECDSLEEITIPDSVTSIGDLAFRGCFSLRTIHIPYGTRNKFEEMLFYGKDKLVET